MSYKDSDDIGDCECCGAETALESWSIKGQVYKLCYFCSHTPASAAYIQDEGSLRAEVLGTVAFIGNHLMREIAKSRFAPLRPVRNPVLKD